MNKLNPQPFFQNHPLHVLFLAAEADPLIKVGGLGDVAGSLPKALKQLDTALDIRLVIPFHESLHQSNIETKMVVKFSLPTVNQPIDVEVYETRLGNLPLYLIDGEPIRESKSVYDIDPFVLNRKFVFFSLACLELVRYLDWRVDILHANDWHTALAVYELAGKKSTIPEFARICSILSLHNLPFMGTGSEAALEEFEIPAAKNPRMPNWSRTLPLPMGLNAADKIVAVSPTYSQEILTPEYGCDLQNFLHTKQKRITGILNGIDTSVWDPQKDSIIQTNFNQQTLENRIQNKSALQKEFQLEVNAKIPLLTFIGRLDRQKGVDLVIEALERLKSKSWQAILLGSGDKTLEKYLLDLQERFPQKVRLALRFDAALSHRLYAGADILLMPSRYEPCGLAQMIAMRYGCVPVANATGGLVDTIVDAPTNPAEATGFLSFKKDSVEFANTLKKALIMFEESKIWEQIQLNGMHRDFSWQNSAKQYLELYSLMVK